MLKICPLLFTIVAGSGLLQAEKVNDLTVYIPKPAPVLPPAGGLFTDPNYGTTILRVTDENDGPTSVPIYSLMYPAFNADSKRFFYSGTAGALMVADLDVANRRVTNKRQIPTPPNGFGGTGTRYWSWTNPDVFYVFSGPILWKYDFKAASYTQLFDFSTISAGTTSVGSRGMSDDETRFEVTMDGALSGQQCIFDTSLGAMAYCIDSSRTAGSTKGDMDSSGRYIAGCFTGNCNVGNLVDSTNDSVNTIPLQVHADLVHGMIAGSTSAGNGFFPGFHLLNSAGFDPAAKIVGPQAPWIDDAHSGIQDATGKWMVVSYESQSPSSGCVNAGGYWVHCADASSVGRLTWTWDKDGVQGVSDATGHWAWAPNIAGTTNPANPFPFSVTLEGDIVEVDTTVPPLSVVEDANGNPAGMVTLPDGTTYPTWDAFANDQGPKMGLCPAPWCGALGNRIVDTLVRKTANIRRVVHHYSDVTIMSDPGLAYWAQPHAIGSRDNCCILYGSNYGNPNRIDVFIAFLDAGNSTPPPVPLTIAPSTVQTLTGGASLQFTANQPNVTWSISPVFGTISPAGLYTSPQNVTQPQTVTVTATSNSNSTSSAHVLVNLTPAAMKLTISPDMPTLNAGQTQQFTATISGSSDQTVTWQIVPSDLGSITSTGIYTAPNSIKSNAVVTLTAKAVANPSVSLTTVIFLRAGSVAPKQNPTPPPAPVAITLDKTAVSLKPGDSVQFTAAVTNATNTNVAWSISPLLGTLTPSGFYTAPNNVTSTLTVVITANSVADPTKSASANITITPSTPAAPPPQGPAPSTPTPPAPVPPTPTPTPVPPTPQPVTGVTISPVAVTLHPGDTQQFTATVQGGANSGVRWAINPQIGAVSPQGLYTAPASVSGAALITISAESIDKPVTTIYTYIIVTP